MVYSVKLTGRYACCEIGTLLAVAGIGAASFCGVYGTKDTAESPVPAALNGELWLMFLGICCLMELVLYERGGQPPKKRL